MFWQLAFRILRATYCVALITLCGAATLPAGPQEKAPAEACMPDLSSLGYPSAALEKRIMGPVNVTFSVDSDGKINSLESNSYPLLLAGVAEALRASRLGPECYGKKVTMRVNFKLVEEATASSTIKKSATEYDVIAQAPTITVEIFEYGPVGIKDLYKAADLVAVLRILSGDTEHYSTAVYKAEVQKTYKGTKDGAVLYFGPFIGYKLGNEYVAFLSKFTDKLVPKALPGLSYGIMDSSYRIMNDGDGVMPLGYACVFDEKADREHCDYGVKIDTYHVSLPHQIKTFPVESEDEGGSNKKWVRRDSFLSLLDSIAKSQ